MFHNTQQKKLYFNRARTLTKKYCLIGAFAKPLPSSLPPYYATIRMPNTRLISYVITVTVPAPSADASRSTDASPPRHSPRARPRSLGIARSSSVWRRPRRRDRGPWCPDISPRDHSNPSSPESVAAQRFDTNVPRHDIHLSKTVCLPFYSRLFRTRIDRDISARSSGRILYA